jgi:hypothetical protein
VTAREYAKVLPAFWTGTTGRAIRALGADCQVIALYLMTSPHASAIGLYHLPLAYLCADTGSPLEGARKALRSLSEVSFCAYDEASETVWIPEMARHQVGDVVKPSDNRRPWLVKEAERMRKRPFFNDFLTKYGAAFSLGIAPDTKTLGSPLEAPSEALRSQEQEQEQEREQQREGARGAQPSPMGSFLGSFDTTGQPYIDAFRDGWHDATGTRLPVGGKNRLDHARKLREAMVGTGTEEETLAMVRAAAKVAAGDPECRGAQSPFAFFVGSIAAYVARASDATKASGSVTPPNPASAEVQRLRDAAKARELAGDWDARDALRRQANELARSIQGAA